MIGESIMSPRPDGARCLQGYSCNLFQPVSESKCCMFFSTNDEIVLYKCDNALAMALCIIQSRLLVIQQVVVDFLKLLYKRVIGISESRLA